MLINSRDFPNKLGEKIWLTSFKKVNETFKEKI
nr:MAG TPA: hypothetical protein [Caudoviricetes sp.]